MPDDVRPVGGLSRFVTSCGHLNPGAWPGGRGAARENRGHRGRPWELQRSSAAGRSHSEHPRNQVRTSHATRRYPRRQMEHARNQVGTKTAAAVATRGGEQVGWRPQGGGTKAARPTFDASRNAVEGRPPIPAAGHDPSSVRAPITQIAPGVRGAPTRHRAGVGRSISRDPLLHPARPRTLHRRGG